MCHRLDLSGRLDQHPYSLDAADLLLTKLQIHEINRKDLVDAVRLLLTHENADIAGGGDGRINAMSLDRLRSVTSTDWGWFTTVTDNLQLVRARPPPTCSNPTTPGIVEARADEIDDRPQGRAQVHAMEGAQRRRPQDTLVRAARRSRRRLMKDTKIFFATDIHGSDRVPEEVPQRREVLRRRRRRDGRRHHRQDDRADRGGSRPTSTSAHLFGRSAVRGLPTGLPGLHKFIADAGFYPHHMTPEEMTALTRRPGGRRRAVPQADDPDHEPAGSTWPRTASAAPASRCIFAPGNDDPLFIDDLLSGSDVVVNPDSRVIELPGGFPMISVGYSNRTPWDSPRELDEDDLAEGDREEVAKLARPPACSDLQPARPAEEHPDRPGDGLDAEFRPVVKGGRAGDHRRRQLGGTRRHRQLPADDEPARPYPRVPRRGPDRQDRRAQPGQRVQRGCAARRHHHPLAEEGAPWLPARLRLSIPSTIEIGVIGSARIDPDDPRYMTPNASAAPSPIEGWTVVTGGYGGLMGATSIGSVPPPAATPWDCP